MIPASNIGNRWQRGIGTRRIRHLPRSRLRFPKRERVSFATRISACGGAHPIAPKRVVQKGISPGGKKRQLTKAMGVWAQKTGASRLNSHADRVAVELGSAQQADALVIEISPGAFPVVFAE